MYHGACFGVLNAGFFSYIYIASLIFSAFNEPNLFYYTFIAYYLVGAVFYFILGPYIVTKIAARHRPIA